MAWTRCFEPVVSLGSNPRALMRSGGGRQLLHVPIQTAAPMRGIMPGLVTPAWNFLGLG